MYGYLVGYNYYVIAEYWTFWRTEMVETIREIEQAVSSLTESDFFRFRAWFYDYDAKIWDSQIEADVRSGKLDDLANRAVADFEAGKYKYKEL